VKNCKDKNNKIDNPITQMRNIRDIGKNKKDKRRKNQTDRTENKNMSPFF
jgi:hypothetical protein